MSLEQSQTIQNEYIVNGNGHVIRAGIYRESNEVSRAYAQQALQAPAAEKSNQDCVFCPEGVRSQQDIEELPYGARFAPSAPYAVFGGHKIDRHKITASSSHIEALWELSDEEMEAYIATAGLGEQLAKRNNQLHVTYARSWDSLSKTVPHLHPHDIILNPEQVIDFEYSMSPAAGLARVEYRSVDGVVDAAIEDSYRVAGTTPVMNDRSETFGVSSNQFIVESHQQPFTWFDGHKVNAHEVITLNDPEQPFAQLGRRALRTYMDYLADRNHELADKGEDRSEFTQDFALNYEMGRFVCHMLTLDYAAVADIRKSRSSGEEHIYFMSPTEKQIQQINRAH